MPGIELPTKSILAPSPLVWVRGPTGRSGLLGGSAPGLLRELVLGGRGFLGGMAGTEGFCKSSFGSLSGLSFSSVLFGSVSGLSGGIFLISCFLSVVPAPCLITGAEGGGGFLGLFPSFSKSGGSNLTKLSRKHSSSAVQFSFPPAHVNAVLIDESDYISFFDCQFIVVLCLIWKYNFAVILGLCPAVHFWF